ncbi:hypothetical protein OAO87_04840 [bacterium]|nr:hypothetical protein [bacterium]
MTYSFAVFSSFMLGLRLLLLLHAPCCYGFMFPWLFRLRPLQFTSAFHFPLPLWVMPADVQVIV